MSVSQAGVFCCLHQNGFTIVQMEIAKSMSFNIVQTIRSQESIIHLYLASAVGTHLKINLIVPIPASSVTSTSFPLSWAYLQTKRKGMARVQVTQYNLRKNKYKRE